MVLAKNNYLHFIFALSVLFIIALCITSYVIINKVNINDPLQKNYYQELLVFFTLVFLLFIILFYAFIFYKNIRVFKEIDKIIDLTKFGNYNISSSLGKLGKLGIKIDDLFYQLNLLNELKSIKISSLSNITGFLLENTPLHLFIIDIEGLIIQCNNNFVKKFKIELPQVLYNNINFILKDLDLKTLIFDLDRTKEHILKHQLTIHLSETNFTVNINFVPVFNIKNQLSNIICYTV